MIITQIPGKPWEIIGADLATYRNSTYLVVQDYYSKYPEIRKLGRITCQEVIEHFQDIMSHHGIPIEMRTDNGRQFDSYEFRKFAKRYGFKWTSSSPEYQQANGQAESAVKLIKKILKTNDDMYKALLIYRNTPLKCGASPAQLLYGRSLRDPLPRIEAKLKPKLPNHAIIRQKLKTEKEEQKRNYDKRHRVRENTNLEPGDRVWIINKKRDGIIKEIADEPRSYIVQTEKEDLRRNRRHLQKLPQISEQTPDGPREDQYFEEAETRTEIDEPRRRGRERRVPLKLKDFVK
nr:uncharacterized protein K02A2.6-like isoform X1 [Onthophagus taurus]XP_022912556.1 uncharacterized protein K02A2.6-like isoform X1 [Onthophagus taurus]XP_022912557.1 uncharacterized protein K02A2.6-like isoform X1 [Onthophagus taurus]